MKTVQKGLVASLVLAAAGLTVWSAAASRREVAAPVEQAPSAEQGVPADALSAAMASPAVSAADMAPPAPSEGDAVPAPADLKITVRETRQGRVLQVRRHGHLIAVRSSGERRVGMHEIDWPVRADGGEITWEATNAKTLETLRGRVTVGEGGEVTIENTIRASVVSDDARPSHRCLGHADGAGGFVVLCRVDGPAAATSVDGKDPRQGVWSLAGDRTLVRFDLPMTGDGASARVLGYEKGGKGVLVRVEASRAPGEIAAVLAIGSDSRSQPEPVRRFGCFCRLPPRDDLL